MGLRFRKTIPLGSLFRISLSKSGLSLGMGPRGMNVNIGPRGIRKTIGLPGTGISYQDTQGWNSASTPSPNSPPAAPEHTDVSWFKVIGVILLVALGLAALGSLVVFLRERGDPTSYGGLGQTVPLNLQA